MRRRHHNRAIVQASPEQTHSHRTVGSLVSKPKHSVWRYGVKSTVVYLAANGKLTDEQMNRYIADGTLKKNDAIKYKMDSLTKSAMEGSMSALTELAKLIASNSDAAYIAHKKREAK